MEAQAAFVGADGVVELNAVASVDLGISLVIDPGNAEHDLSVGFNHAKQNTIVQEFRLLILNDLQ